MEIEDLISKFSSTTENQQKVIFSSLFIMGNKLQTLLDNNILEISLKQFMLLSIIINAKELLTFTQLEKLLVCSRQNVKKISVCIRTKGIY